MSMSLEEVCNLKSEIAYCEGFIESYAKKVSNELDREELNRIAGILSRIKGDLKL